MSEYIIKAADWAIDINGDTLYKGCDEIVRCRDCRHYYVAENYHPSGNYFRNCCTYFDTYNDEVEPDSFCAWGERREGAE